MTEEKEENKNEKILDKRRKQIFYTSGIFAGAITASAAVTIASKTLEDTILSNFLPRIHFMEIAIPAVVLFAFGITLLQYLKIGQISYKAAETKVDSELSKLSDQDLSTIVSAMQRSFADQTSSGIIQAVYMQTQKKLDQYSEVNVAGSVFSSTIARLAKEIFSLQRRGNLNLVLGIIITVIGLAALWYLALAIDVHEYNNDQFVRFFLPRLSLVLLIEVFAYFFLRLYKSSLSDIKFFQNELTNIESKLTAMQLAFAKNDSQERLCVITQLIKTERNQQLQNKCNNSKDVSEDNLIVEVIKTTISEILSKTNKKD